MEIINTLTHPSRLLAALWARVGQSVADNIYLKWRFRFIFGEKLHLDSPKGYNEKINWLKIYNRNPLYPKLVDKAEVKDYVRQIIGEDKIIKTLGVWDKFEDIDLIDLIYSLGISKTKPKGYDERCIYKGDF